MDFAALLTGAGFDLRQVAIMLHQPSVAGHRAALSALVVEHPDLFEKYQDNHPKNAEATLKARPYAASFVVNDLGEARFVGVYRVKGWTHQDHARPLPDWNDLVLTADQIRALPGAWADRVSQWRGIYHVIDASDGGRYVGSAYGAENILGRWRAHVAGDKGVTVELGKRDPSRFRFSILELLAPTAPVEDVVVRENSWKERLGTREWGLNRN